MYNISIIIREHFSHVHHISLQTKRFRTSPLLLQVQLRPRAGYSSVLRTARLGFTSMSNPAPQALSPTRRTSALARAEAESREAPLFPRGREWNRLALGPGQVGALPALSAWATSGPAWSLRAKTLRLPDHLDRLAPAPRSNEVGAETRQPSPDLPNPAESGNWGRQGVTLAFTENCSGVSSPRVKVPLWHQREQGRSRSFKS